MTRIKKIYLKETDSTNRYLNEYKGEEGELMTIAISDYQTAGRGQGGNSWESEAGKNLTFSIKVRPKNVPVALQYIMLEAESLAIKDALSHYTDGITIKWPNDVYYRDMKISGTLSECAISGDTIKSCILGTGIDVNQQQFMSDAPNPISIYQIIGHDVDRNELMDRMLNSFETYLDMVNSGRHDEISNLYMASLYRREGQFCYKDKDGIFEATISAVEPNGHLVLKRTDGTISRYAFKEVIFLINKK